LVAHVGLSLRHSGIELRMQLRLQNGGRAARFCGRPRQTTRYPRYGPMPRLNHAQSTANRAFHAKECVKHILCLQAWFRVLLPYAARSVGWPKDFALGLRRRTSIHETRCHRDHVIVPETPEGPTSQENVSRKFCILAAQATLTDRRYDPWITFRICQLMEW
jgi:hypothetical protein